MLLCCCEITEVVEDESINATESVGDDIVFAGNMLEISRELADEVQIANCFRQSIVIWSGEGGRERFMVGENSEFTAFDLMTEMADGFFYGEEFTRIGRIAAAALCRGELFREEPKRLPSSVNFLIECASHCNVARVGKEGEWCVRERVRQSDCADEGKFLLRRKRREQCLSRRCLCS